MEEEEVDGREGRRENGEKVRAGGGKSPHKAKTIWGYLEREKVPLWGPGP